MIGLSAQDIQRLLALLNDDLRSRDIRGEIFLVGGAVMCLVHQARPSTRDLDGIFMPAKELRAAAARVATEVGITEHWLNDAVKGFFSATGDYEPFMELSNLKVSTATAPYLLAMKCLAARIGEEFYDVDDIRYLLRWLNIASYQAALAVIERYYPLERIPQKTLYLLEELLAQP